MPRVGPYDRFAVSWAYKSIPEAGTAEEELSTLDAWTRQQDQTPWFRYVTTEAADSDPGELVEAVRDADAILSSGLGLVLFGIGSSPNL